MFKKLIAGIWMALLCTALHGQKVMSFNIRYDNPQDGENSWENRRASVIKLIDRYDPDFLGVQEGLLDQVTFIDDAIALLSYVGVGRDDGKQKGEHAAIFYDSSKYELLYTKTFWLSETPDSVSVGWDASMERICTYGAFKSRQGDGLLHIFNAHFDHRGPQARKMSAKTILKKINDLNIADEKIIVMGDFNCLPNDEPVQLFMEFLDDGLKNSATGLQGAKGTFNGFDPQLIPEERIDYIFTKNIKHIKSYHHIGDKRGNGLCISDHLPVLMLF